jgi:hypothetical protein
MNYGNKQHSHRVLTVVTRLLRRGGSNQRLLSLVFAFAVAQGSLLTSFLRFFLAMADVSDPKINEGAFVNSIMMRFQFLTNPTAYEDVRSNKSDVNWVLVDYEVRP